MVPHRKKSRPAPLADFVGAAVDPVLAKLGFGQSSLILHWDDIVGERIAACCEPIKLQWPQRPAKRPDDAAPKRFQAEGEPGGVKKTRPHRKPEPRFEYFEPEKALEPATLVLRVAGAMALEIQHSAPQLIARVNAHLGWRAVGRLAIRQGPLTRAARPGRPPPPDPRAIARAEQAVTGVEDEALRKALVALGARALGGPGQDA